VIAEYLQKVDPKSDGARRDWVAIYDECASVLYQHPGNIAVDDANGGRLIFYDFGMMGRLSLELLLSLHTSWKEIILLKCSYLSNKFHSTNLCSISSNIREGLLETFYGIYEKDPDRVTQVKEREMATTELGFKKPLTKEERLEKKKQRLAAIGETYDVSICRVCNKQETILLSKCVAFGLNSTNIVTLVCTVLDGIGKGLDPRFDITEIAKP
ncbi:hypothetical protein BHM03_00044212, partial [Ensete ventricosum]